MEEKIFHDKTIQEWLVECPILADIIATKPVVWLNQEIKSFSQIQSQIDIDYNDVQDAPDRLERFRPYIERAFPETEAARGKIGSPLVKIPVMHKRMERLYDLNIPGTLLAKLDSHLPISGSIKARGGIYEVLKFAETTAISHSQLKAVGQK